jgi:hypothetical protein
MTSGLWEIVRSLSASRAPAFGEGAGEGTGAGHSARWQGEERAGLARLENTGQTVQTVQYLQLLLLSEFTVVRT